MQYDEVVLGRRSIRGFKKSPVPKALIEEVRVFDAFEGGSLPMRELKNV